jgi:3-oxoacyl-[acyl-carrier-protein] synthase II
MAHKRVVITGVGVVSAAATGLKDFARAVLDGKSGIGPISLFDVSQYKVKTAAEVRDFNPQQFLGEKGLRLLDRSTRLASVAAKLALEDAGLEINEGNSCATGVALGTTFGSLKSICDFDREALLSGPQYVNPGLFPNTVINSPASQISIRFNIKGFNATISSAFCSSLEAIAYAADFIKMGRAEAALAGGVEELCEQTFLGFYKLGLLAGLSAGASELSCPFDKRRNGILLGEGAGIVALEELSLALKRKARIYAEVCASGAGRTCDRKGLSSAMSQALANAQIRTQDINYICAAADSDINVDAAEAGAINDVFGENTPVSSIKPIVGECISASGAMQLAACILAMENNLIPATLNYQEKDPCCDLNHVIGRPQEGRISRALINACGPCGASASMVISKFAG